MAKIYVDERHKNLNDNAIVPFFNDSVESCIGGTDNMSDDILKALTKDVESKKSATKEIAYKDLASVILTAEQQETLALLGQFVEEYEPKFKLLESFMKSNQWAEIVKKISANDDTVKYLNRRTAIVSGEALRLIATVKEIRKKYHKKPKQ